MDLRNQWFDLEAFKKCGEEQGIPISFCKKETISPANPEYSIKAQIGFKCRSVTGHIERKRSVISANVGSVVAEQVFAYILPIGFSAKEVEQNSYLLVGDVYYQMELVESVYSRGTVIQYKYKLDKTDGTMFK